MVNLISKTLLLSIVIFVTASVFLGEVSAQCAMCRVTLENNVSNGEVGIAAGLNMAILYLFAAPYLVVGFIAFLWYRKSKLNAKEQSYTTG